MGTVRSSWFGLAGLTEQADYCTEGTRKLAIFVNPYEKAIHEKPIYSFHTYNIGTNKKATDVSQNVEVEPNDNDYSWNWFYFAYSEAKKQAFSYVKFGSLSKTAPVSLTFNNIEHNTKLKSLKLILGKCEQVPNANGQFFDINFDFTPGCFMNSPKTVQDALASLPVPKDFFARN